MCEELSLIKTQIIQREYQRRVDKNPSYSKRAFARDLGVSHTLLSLVETNKRQLSNKTAQKILNSKNYLSSKERKLLTKDLKDFKKREDEQKSDEFIKLISDWRYYAILNLTSVEDFSWDKNWIGKRLGISTSVAKRFMDKLVRLKLVEQLESGTWVRRTPSISTSKSKVSESAKKFNRELIKKSLEAMEEVSYEKRDLSSVTFAMDPEFVDYAVERIRNFRRSLSNELENLGEKKEVYTISVQLFPLTKQESI